MKKLYKQFNELNIGVDLEPMEISEMEIVSVKRAVLKQKKKKHLPKNLSAAAAIIIVSVLALGFTFPAFATKMPLIGNLYEYFKHDNKEYIFGDYKAHSKDIGVTKESSGISVTVTDAVYDKDTITIAYKIQSKKDLGKEPVLEGTPSLGDDDYRVTSTRYITKKISNKEYAGLYIVFLHGTPSDKVHVQWDGHSILSYGIKPINGDWPFQFTLTALKGQTHMYKGLLSKNKDIEVELWKMSTTPISTNLYFSEKIGDKWMKQWKKENWEFISIRYAISDNIGNKYNTLVGNSAIPESIDSRISTSVINKKATSITIIPKVTIIKNQNEPNEVFTLKPIKVPVNK